jgi:hypothetical protein
VSYVLVAALVSIPCSAWRECHHAAAAAHIPRSSSPRPFTMKPTITMRVFPLLLVTLLASLLATALSDADDTWILLGTGTVSGAADHDTLSVTGEGGVVGKLQLRVRGAALRFQRIVVRYDDGDDDRIELSRDEIPAGGESRTIDLRGHDRVIRSLDLWYHADSLGARPAVIEVYGRR